MARAGQGLIGPASAGGEVDDVAGWRERVLVAIFGHDVILEADRVPETKKPATRTCGPPANLLSLIPPDFSHGLARC